MVEKAAPWKPWSRAAAALWGGVLGSLLELAHVIHGFLVGLFPNIDPFVHVLSEFAIFGVGGAVLFALVAEICNRLKRD